MSRSSKRTLISGYKSGYISSVGSSHRRCITANQQFIWMMLSVFDEDDSVPPHLLHANAAGEEAKAAHHVVTPEEADKVRRHRQVVWGES